MKISQLFNALKVLIVAMILALGIKYAAAVGTWTTAPSNPPQSNVDAPLNVATGSQVKEGGLLLNSISLDGVTKLDYGLKVLNSPIKAEGGLIIQVCSVSAANCPDQTGTPETGRMWIANP